MGRSGGGPGAQDTNLREKSYLWGNLLALLGAEDAHLRQGSHFLGPLEAILKPSWTPKRKIAIGVTLFEPRFGKSGSPRRESAIGVTKNGWGAPTGSGRDTDSGAGMYTYKTTLRVIRRLGGGIG